MKPFVIEKIKEAGGYLPYGDYIELILYDKTYGYYQQTKKKIGREGDFYTSSYVSEVFAKVIARQFVQWVESGKLDANFCEIGSGEGRFLASFREECKRLSPEVSNRMCLYSVEKSTFHQKLLRKQFGQEITLLTKFQDLQSFNGFVFSNELFDAYPVDIIVKDSGSVYEVVVSSRNDELVENFIPLEKREIIDYLDWQEITLSDGQRFEVPIKMAADLERLNHQLNQAVIMTIDYGYTNKEWSLAQHQKGSLRGYSNHQLYADVLEKPFEMDVTTHIHLDAYQKKAEENGWKTVFSNKQEIFLIESGILDYLEQTTDPNPFSEINKRNRQIRSLITPGGISSHMHVFVHSKGIKHEMKLGAKINKKKS
ncbi:SAM-dependent methyltransferase [Metabacillus arenae]|uniref:SAM-dependent methyltransferase n=1 Tax=Metabacillus arenae TaxID=2771434 RepID=A0A926RZA9_9BACI|nr:SAM-dependent methyltransferase [Metabacillus arenae]MBD1378874.1 SAM-dependent methyltransferase [Metabacillus arenae]